MPHDWMQTFTGRHIRPTDPESHGDEDIDIRDIMWSLSKQDRYNGHGVRMYTVGEHLLRFMEIMNNMDRDVQAEGLMHDASEAYLHDITRPFKHSDVMTPYRELEARWEDRIFTRFNLSYPMHPTVRMVDNYMVAIEARPIMNASAADWGILEDPKKMAEEIEEVGGVHLFDQNFGVEPHYTDTFQQLMNHFHRLEL